MLIFSGCKEEDTDKHKYQIGFQPPIDKLYWGMSLEEIEDTLLIQDGVDNVVYTYDDPVTTIILPEKTKRFGYEASVSLQICDEPDVDWFPYKSNYLINVKLIYTDIVIQNLKKSMIKEFDDVGEDKTSIVYKEYTVWKSKDKISNLEPELLTRLEEYWKLLDDHVAEGIHYSIRKPLDEQINTVMLVYGESNSAMIIYDGDTAVPINKICFEMRE